MNDLEEYRDVKGYEGYYKVSNKGNVISVQRYVKHPAGTLKLLKERKLKNSITKHGYMSVWLSKNGKVKGHRIHRLAAEAFINNPDNKPHINHIDACVTNNNINNLEWVTPMENVHHTIKLGRARYHKGRVGKLNNKSKPVVQKTASGRIVNTYESANLASKNTGINRGHISAVARGERNYAGGYRWHFVLLDP